MLAVAQTILQLSNQMLRLEYSVRDLGELRVTYDLARELFSGLFKAFGQDVYRAFDRHSEHIGELSDRHRSR